MTREELIKAIDENEDAWSCPDYACDMPEKEGNTGECCLKCAEKQLKAYEDKIKAEAIDEFTIDIINRINFEDKWLFICKSNNADTNIMFSALRNFVKNRAKQLKEQNK